MDPRIKLIRDKINDYPDFPIKGVLFRDLFGALADADALKALMSLCEEKAAGLKGHIDAVVGLDARGFLFGPTMAVAAKVPFVPVRKKGKLPGETLAKTYDLEYGTATVEVQKSALTGVKRVLIVDDLLATGGTLGAAVDLVRQVGDVERVEAFVVIELGFLKGRDKLSNVNVDSIFKF